MEKTHIEEVDRRVDSATVLRPLTEALGATEVALNYYELAPGNSFAYGYHAHSAVYIIRRQRSCDHVTTP